MNLSIVIRCEDDERVFRCIDSIDEDVEVIVSLSENKSLQHKLEKMGIQYCISPQKNLSKTSNIGFNKASQDRVIITDSDTIFENKCINQLNNALDNHKVAKAGIIFDIHSKNPLSRFVSDARDYVNRLPLVFTPGIAIRKDILENIGGFLFNDTVPYAVDADLNYRIKKSGISVAWLMDKAHIIHSPESVSHDLKAAHRIGKGCRISIESLRKLDKNSTIKWNELKAVKTSLLPNLIMKKGLIIGLYQLLWDISYWTGYCSQVIKK